MKSRTLRSLNSRPSAQHSFRCVALSAKVQWYSHPEAPNKMLLFCIAVFATCRGRFSLEFLDNKAFLCIILELADLFIWYIATGLVSTSNILISWLMEPRASMPHSQGLPNNPYPELNQPKYPHWYQSLQGPV